MKHKNSFAKRCAAVLIASAVGYGLFMSPAQASADVKESPIVALVMNSSDPAAAYQALAPAERAEFDYWMLPAKEFNVTSITPVDGPAQKVAALGEQPTAMAAAALNGCWYGKNRKGNKAKGGNTLYTYFTTMKWCTKNNKVTSAAVYEADGETSTPGWRYDGVKAKAAAVIDNKARAYAKHKFILGIGGFDIQSPTHCTRVWGYSNRKDPAFDTACGTV